MHGPCKPNVLPGVVVAAAVAAGAVVLVGFGLVGPVELVVGGFLILRKGHFFGTFICGDAPRSADVSKMPWGCWWILLLLLMLLLMLLML